VRRKVWYLVGLLIIALIAACKAGQSAQVTPQPITGDNVEIAEQPLATTTPAMIIPEQIATQAPTHAPIPTTIYVTVSGPAPYGPPPPLTAEEIQLTQQLFALINHDRAVRDLYPFAWNSTLAAGARLHSWNMVHCGFSHTCPDGLDQCIRIANEGFQDLTDCGENIGLAGPYPTPWAAVYAVQESMINEPPTGWHRIHLTSTTLHNIGVGVYVDSRGWTWFTEDMIS
jgi:uncharacterized protein YkwD